MYWYTSVNSKIVDSNGDFIARMTGPAAAAKIVDDHNEAIRQLAQQEVTGSAARADVVISILNQICKDNYGTEVGNEIHLQRGDDGWWYATTTVDMLDQ